MTSYKICGCFSRNFKIAAVTPSKDIEEVFQKYAENGYMYATQLHQFLLDMQGHAEATLADAELIIRTQMQESKVLPKLYRIGFTLNLFFRYLLNTNLNPPYDCRVRHDMTSPLSHYFIFTGHNSYLTGNQLSSVCSDKPIIKALLKGVRVIELDLWPNSTKDKVIVLHGRTLTTPVEFEMCIVAIKEHAFIASEYPVVITLEDHLTSTLQALASKIITETLGDILYYPEQKEKVKEFPSPESLKRRILISTKPPKEYLAGKSGNMHEENNDGKSGNMHEENNDVNQHSQSGDWGEEIPDYCDEIASHDNHVHLSEQMESEIELSDEEGEAKKLKDAAPEYKRIITIRAGKPKGSSVKDALKVGDEAGKRVSLSEPQLGKIAKSHPSRVIRFTQRHILRVYPYGLRVDSSNYNPLVSWTHGAQMVALNMQGYGRPLWLVQGFFKANGGCGYVKKPTFLLPNDDDKVFDPCDQPPVKTTLKVKVILGLGWLEKFGKRYFDTYSPPDFYTRVGIAGVPADSKMKKTATIEDDWTPKWDTEFEFPLTVPEMALLRVEVHEYDMSYKDDFAGQTCLPVKELKTGYRSIPLYDKRGDELAGVRLLFRFQFA